MKTISNTVNNSEFIIDTSSIGEANDCVFIDIETTGLSSEHSYIYLIGAAYFDNSKNSWEIKQWLISSPSEEKEMLTAVTDFILSYKTVVHYNGNSFDLPFINARCKACGIDWDFANMAGVDIYKRVSSLKHFFKLDSCKQKSIEAFMGIQRDDENSGKELIKVYREYSSTGSEDKEKLLLLHNHDDVLGMLRILPVLNYTDIFFKGVSVKKVQTNIYNDVLGMSKKELIISIALPSSIPVAINYNANGCYFSAKESDGLIKVPLLHEEMKYFYSNYQDYYYLPEEDVAIHKSVSEYVDKDFREPAKAHNCYTRKVSDYLPQWAPVEFEPFFKRDYDSSFLYFELTDELKTNRDAFKKYADHVLKMMYNSK